MAGFGGSIKLTGESEYQKALRQITQNLKEVSSEMKVVTSSYDKNDKSIQALSSKQDVLNKRFTEQTNKLNTLKAQYSSMNSQYQESTNKHNALVNSYNKEKAQLDILARTVGTTSKEYQDQQKVVNQLEKEVIKSSQAQDQNAKTMSNMRVQINNAQSDINKTTREIDSLTQEIKEAEKPTNNLGEELEDAGEKARIASNEGFTVMKGALADLTSKAIQGAIEGVKKLAGAMIDLGKQSISNYANYEQLVGGVETLFKESSDIVQGYAQKAYKTAGLSANEYMETVTSFSASLLQSLGQDTKKSAEYADLAVTDMSDNANKMGTSMEMIQNAYQGFAKQNFTMLDNLKLGYGGTKTEMERLIKDANRVKEANGEMADLSIKSFADMVEAIHIIQTQMGITGTTALEADKTISGSVNSMKSAWQNLLTAIADDNQDLEKSIDEFVDSVITVSQNLVPRVKKVVEGTKKLINSITNDVLPKLKREIPELAPLIDTFQWFIKNKSLVTGAIKTMVAAFAIKKIADFTKGISDTGKTLLDMTKAMTIATTATTANTTAQVANTTAQTAGSIATKTLTGATNLLNAAWKANPVGVVVAGVTALIAAYNTLKGLTTQLSEEEKKQQAIMDAQSKAIKEQYEEVKENKKAWDELVQAQKQQIDVGMTEISHLQSLKDELVSIVDENGKVKKGYEGRASFILSTLNEALGTEYTMTGNIIDQYKKLTSSIDDVIEKKKAQIILDSQESLYAEAIKNQVEATNKLYEIEGEYQQRLKDRSKLEEELNNAFITYNNAKLSGNTYAVAAAAAEIDKIYEKIEAYDADTQKLESSRNKQLEIVEGYAYNIGLYETNMALAHEGKYSEMSQVTWDYVKEYQKAGDAEKAMLEKQILDTENQLTFLKDLKDRKNTEMYDSQIETYEKQLSSLKENLDKYNSVTDEELGETTIIWQDNLDDQLSEITGSKVEFREDGKGNVQAYIDGVASGKSKSKDEMAKIVAATIKEISKQETGAKEAGEDLIDGVNNGIANERKQSGAFSAITNFGNKLLNKLRASLDEHSPSKATNQMGQFLLQGLGLGIEDEENSILKQVTNFGRSVISSLNQGLSGNVDMSSISRIGNNIPKAYDNNQVLSNANKEEFTYNSMVEAFQEALASMKIELDDEEAGRFVRKTVEDTIYT